MRQANPNVVSLPQYMQTQGYTTQGIGKIYDPRCVDSNLDSLSWNVPYYKTSVKYFPKETGAPELDYQFPETKEQNRKYRMEGERKGLACSIFAPSVYALSGTSAHSTDGLTNCCM